MPDERVAGGMTDGDRPTAPDPIDDTEATEDTEGQSLGALTAARELGRDRRPRSQARDDDLPALTKKFPRMRDDRR